MSDISVEAVENWRVLPKECLGEVLERITNELTTKFTFENISVKTRKAISKLFVELFESQESDEAMPSAATAMNLCRLQICFMRILCRDQNNLDGILIDDRISRFIVKFALLTEQETPLSTFECNERIDTLNGDGRSSKELIKTKLKYLNELTETDINRLALYDLRIAFILTAHSLKLQTDWLSAGNDVLFERIIATALEQHQDELKSGRQTKTASLISAHSSSTSSAAVRQPPTPYADRCMEALKVLFNLFCHTNENNIENSNKHSMEQCARTCANVVLLDDVEPSIEQAAVNVLATIPSVLGVLLSDEVDFLNFFPKNLQIKFTKTATKAAKPHLDLQYDGVDMRFVDVLLNSLNRRIEPEIHDEYELLGTYFTVLIHLCTHSKEARRFARLKVMPPLHAHDVERRPDEGNEFRNKVVRIMMSSCNCRQLAAEFLFILCKRSVNRLLKYCGFGNAAGLLANYGFLGAINQPRASDSEDSETEDYKEVENLLVGMSEEQKEYEAMQLVNAMSKLMDQGVISPGTIGDDGRIRAVKHILELTETNDKNRNKEEGDDDDDSES
ncbi:unnamed protein product [Anisakis simplex]|uniref:Synembryn (inferred by orthology to a C. elegans protein) n=1 Tax=Anisakis simplex TaxID=6269 RepID=A0A0M3JQU4_ANISI|nr:unnamed protein product [Anisakis simplex]